MYSKELQIGTAAEHLVVADLLLQGYSAFLTEAGCPFDVTIVVGNKPYRIQVKATNSKPKLHRRAATEAYRFGLRWGKAGRKQHPDSADIFAFVTLDTKTIAYLTHTDFKSKLPQIVEFRTEEAATRSIRTYTNGRQRVVPVRVISKYPFSRILGCIT